MIITQCLWPEQTKPPVIRRDSPKCAVITFLPLWTPEFWDNLLFSSALLTQALRSILHPFAWNGAKGFSSVTNGSSQGYSGCCVISPEFYLELSWVWTCSLVHTESQHCQVVQHIREREKESKREGKRERKQADLKHPCMFTWHRFRDHFIHLV